MSESTVVVIGVFDGVHKGHQALLNRAKEIADGRSIIALTFDPHPRAVFAPDSVPPMLTTLADRVELLKIHNADQVAVMKFNEQLAAMSPEKFVEDILEIRHKEATTLVDIAVTCSAGTYIRAIARDLGAELKVGGHLNVLRRTRVAGFALDQAIGIDQLKGGNFATLDLADVARATFPVRELELEEVNELSFGRPLSPNASDEITAALSPDNRLIALLKNSIDKAKPVAVFAAAN